MILRFFYFVMFSCLFYLVILLILCAFVNTLHISCLFFTSFNGFNPSSGSVFFHVHVNIDNDTDCLKVVIIPLQKIYGYTFLSSVLKQL